MKIKILLAFIILLHILRSNAQTISLAGQWKFAADSLAIGETQHWETKAFAGNIHLLEKYIAKMHRCKPSANMKPVNG